MKIPASAKKIITDSFIPLEKDVMSLVAKSAVETRANTRKKSAKNDKTIVSTCVLLKSFIKAYPPQPGAAMLITTNKSATQPRAIPTNQIRDSVAVVCRTTVVLS